MCSNPYMNSKARSPTPIYLYLSIHPPLSTWPNWNFDLRRDLSRGNGAETLRGL